MAVPTNYQYTISTAFPAGKVNVEYLQDTIQFWTSIVTPLIAINAGVEPDKCDIWFDGPLSAPDQATLDGVVATHPGVGIAATVEGTLQVAQVTTIVTSDLIWQVLGGIVTTPAFFTPIMSQIMGRALGLHKGDGGQLRIVEEVQGEPDVVITSPPFDFPNVGGVFTRFKKDTNVTLRDGTHNLYRVEARLNGATALEIEYAAVSMLKVILY
jgi:hypothetical protein